MDEAYNNYHNCDSTIRYDYEWKQARAIRRSRIAIRRIVVSQSNRNFDHFRRSRMRHGIVVYEVRKYRSLVVVESQL